MDDSQYRNIDDRFRKYQKGSPWLCGVSVYRRNPKLETEFTVCWQLSLHLLSKA